MAHLGCWNEEYPQSVHNLFGPKNLHAGPLKNCSIHLFAGLQSCSAWKKGGPTSPAGSVLSQVQKANNLHSASVTNVQLGLG